MNNAKLAVKELLALADVAIDGSRPFDIKVHDERFYKRILADRELGLGESYMEGWWSVERLDQLVERTISAGLREKIRVSPKIVRLIVLSTIQNRQSAKKARHNASHHYDIGNDLYALMLDKRMIYTCAYWKKAANLDDAQEAKLDLICRKLCLKPGMTLLDIGCGWGGLANYAADKYGARVTGITLAKEQLKIAKERAKNRPVEFLLTDYRDMTGKFDRIVSVGLLEAIGPKNYRHFFKHCKDMLNDGGIMLHQTIGGNRSVNSTDPWIDKYIFPGGVIPSLGQISKAIEKELVVDDIQNLGPDYDKTLLAWHANFVKHYPELRAKYDQRFYKMWEFYLLASAGLFRARHLQLWQIVLKKIEPSETYISPR